MARPRYFRPYCTLDFRRYTATSLLNWTIRQYQSGSAFKTDPFRQFLQNAIISHWNGGVPDIHRLTLWDGSPKQILWMKRIFKAFDFCLFFGCLTNSYGGRGDGPR